MKPIVWALLLVLFISLIYMGLGSQIITGADDRVQDAVEGYAQAAGLKEHSPLIDTDKGELMLFLFAIGGAVSGFLIGYVWRGLFGKLPKQGHFYGGRNER